jgi:hypothetical protein
MADFFGHAYKIAQCTWHSVPIAGVCCNPEILKSSSALLIGVECHQQEDLFVRQR